MSMRYLDTLAVTTWSMRSYPAVGVLWMSPELIGTLPTGHPPCCCEYCAAERAGNV